MMTDHAMPAAVEVRRLLASELSLASRLGYTALALASASVAGVTGALLMTEPGLPARTQAALGAVTLIGLAWTVFAVWVLSRRRVLFAGHRVVASTMAVTFTAAYALGALALALGGGFGRPAFAAAGLGGLMLAVAVALLVRAVRARRALEDRRAELERQLRERGPR
jgi:hypothetical protein